MNLNFNELITPGLLVIVWIAVGIQNSKLGRQLEILLTNEHACKLDMKDRFGRIEKDLSAVQTQQLNHIQRHIDHSTAISRLHQRIDEFKGDWK